MLKLDEFGAYPDGWTCQGPCGREFYGHLPFNSEDAQGAETEIAGEFWGTLCERCATNAEIELLEKKNATVEAQVLEEGAGLDEKVDPLERPCPCPGCGEEACIVDRAHDEIVDHCRGGLHVPPITRCGWCATCDEHMGVLEETVATCEVCNSRLKAYEDSKVAPCRGELE